MDKEKLIEWLEGEKYIYTDGKGNFIEYGTELDTTEEFEKKHQWQIATNRMISKILKYIENN